MNIFIRFYAFLTFRYAVQKAQKYYLENKRRYYVCPNSDSKVRLIVTDRKNFRGLRNKGYISQDYKMQEAYEMCFYCTPHADGKGAMSEVERRQRAKRYFEWYEEQRPVVKAKRKALRKEVRKRKWKSFKRAIQRAVGYGEE